MFLPQRVGLKYINAHVCMDKLCGFFGRALASGFRAVKGGVWRSMLANNQSAIQLIYSNCEIISYSPIQG